MIEYHPRERERQILKHIMRPVRGLGCMLMVAVVMVVLVHFWTWVSWAIIVSLIAVFLYGLGWAIEKEQGLTGRGPHV